MGEAPEQACGQRPADSRCGVCGEGAGPRVWYCPVTMIIDDEATVGGEDTPSVVPGYDIVGVIGQGGMGAVYLARQLATLELVALKRLTTSLAKANLERFRREAQVLKALDVPGVVKVLEIGADDTQPWFAMEWVKGPSLGEVLERNPDFSLDESVRIVGEVARTVAEIHRRGLVHRDLKPANIVLRTDGHPVLVDFGLTRHVDPDAHTNYTRRPIGTPAYMAPELLKGTDVDWVRADIYALGATLARCVLGRMPQGSWDLAGAPEHLRPALEGALQAQPALRFATAEAFAEALTARPVRERRSTPLVAGMIGLGLLGALTAAAVTFPSQTAAPEVAPLLEAYAERVAEGSHQAEEVFERVLDDAEADLVGPLWVERARLLATGEAWAAAWAHADPSDRPLVMQQLADALWREGDLDALDALLASHRDQLAPGPRLDRLTTEVEVYHRRFEQALATATPTQQRLIEPFLERRLHHDQDDLPKAHPRLWTCDPTSCTTPDGASYDAGEHARFMVGDEGLVAWTPGHVRAVEADAHCAVPQELSPYVSTFWDGRYVMVSNGREAGVHQLDLASCALERHPDQDRWAGSFVNRVHPWDADGDGVDELVVYVGPPYGYEIRLYDRDDQLIDAIRVGNVRAGSVWNGDLVVATHQPHGNADAFGLPDVGMHRIVFEEGELRVAQTWPGLWRGATGVDLDGDGTQMLLAVDHRDVAWLYDAPDAEPLRIRNIFGVRVLELDDDPAQEMAVQTVDGGVFLVGNGRGDVPIALPRPDRLDPTGDADVDRALELDAMGLTGVGATQLAAEAVTRPAREAPWQLLGELQLRAGRTHEAIEAWGRAASEGDPGAFRQALQTALREGRIEEVADLVRAHGEPEDPDLRSATQTTTFAFDAAPRAWELARPLAVWNQDRSRVRVHGMGGAGVVAEVGLKRISPYAGVEIELTLDQLEFAGDLWLRLTDRADGSTGPYVRLHAPGSQHRILRTVTAHRWELGERVDNDPFGPHRSTIVLALDGEHGVFSEREPDGTVHRMELEKPLGEQARFQLEIAGPPGAMADLSLERVTFWGFEVQPSLSTRAAGDGFARSVRNTDLRTSPALAPVDPTDSDALSALYESYGTAWRMHRSASRLTERILGLPGFGEPELIRAHPGLALMRADASLVHGDPAAALGVLAELPDDPQTCLSARLLAVAAHEALGDDAAATRARAAVADCAAEPAVVRAEAWSLGLQGVSLEPSSP